MVPLDSPLWKLSTAALGLLLHLHRAVLLHGDRDTGTLPASFVDELAEELGAMRALLDLEAQDIITDQDTSFVRVTTWAGAQGEQDKRQRTQARQRATSTPAPLRPACFSHRKPPESEAAAPVKDTGFVGTEAQGTLFVHELVTPTVLAVATAWKGLEPFNQVREPREFIAKLLQTYPDIDLAEESRKVDAWWYSNPGKRKTKRGVTRFINSWMSNAQMRAVALKRQTTADGGRKADAHASTVDAVWRRKEKIP